MKAKPQSLAEAIDNPHDTFFKSLPGQRALIVEFLRYYPPQEVTADFDLKTLGDVKEAFPKKIGGVMQTAAEIWMRRGLQQGLQQGLRQGEEKTRLEFAEMVLRQLARRLGHISARTEKQIRRLPLPALKELGEAPLDFEKTSDLTAWLREHSPKRKP